MTVRTLEQTIGADELQEWLAYRNIECGLPIEKIEYYLAQLALCFAGDEKSTIEDFLLKRKRKQSRKELKTELMKLKGLAKWQKMRQMRARYM